MSSVHYFFIRRRARMQQQMKEVFPRLRSKRTRQNMDVQLMLSLWSPPLVLLATRPRRRCLELHRLATSAVFLACASIVCLRRRRQQKLRSLPKSVSYLLPHLSMRLSVMTVTLTVICRYRHIVRVVRTERHRYRLERASAILYTVRPSRHTVRSSYMHSPSVVYSVHSPSVVYTVRPSCTPSVRHVAPSVRHICTVRPSCTVYTVRPSCTQSVRRVHRPPSCTVYTVRHVHSSSVMYSVRPSPIPSICPSL